MRKVKHIRGNYLDFEGRINTCIERFEKEDYSVIDIQYEINNLTPDKDDRYTALIQFEKKLVKK